MQMDSRIILMGQPVNALAALDAGTQAAGRAGMVGHQGDLLSLYREQGPGIMAGDANALNALSSLDPMAALGVQETRQGMRIREEQLQLARAAGARAAESHAASLSAAERQREAEQTRRALATALPALQQAEQTGDLTTLNQMLRTAGMNPVNSVEEAYILYMQVEGAVETLETFRGLQPQGPAPTDDMREFEFAQQNPEFSEWMTRNRTSSRVTVGPDGAIEIAEGGPEIWSQAETPPRPAIDGPASALEDIDRALGIIRNNPRLTTGIGGAVMGAVAGSDSVDVANLLTTVNANITFETLNAMRAASTTGSSGLGQVTQTELALLAAVAGSLSQSQSAEQLERNLERLQRTFNQVVHGDPGGPEAAARRVEQGLPLYGQIVNGHVFMGGDPNNASSWRAIQ